MENTQAQPAGLFTGKAVHATRAFSLTGPLPAAQEPAVNDTPAEPTPTTHQEPTNVAPSAEGTSDDLAKIKEELELERKRRVDLQSYKDKEMNILKSQLEAEQRLRQETEARLSEAIAPQRKAPLSDEEFEELSSNFKNIDDLAHTRALKIVEEYLAPYKQKIEHLEKVLKGEAENKAKDALRKLHPDFEQLQTDPDFISWFQDQPRGVKNLIESSDVLEIARGLDFYKKDKGIKSKKEKELDASIAVQVNTPTKPEAHKPKQWAYSELKTESAKLTKLPVEEARAKLAEIDAAVREGRVDYSR